MKLYLEIDIGNYNWKSILNFIEFGQVQYMLTILHFRPPQRSNGIESIESNQSPWKLAAASEGRRAARTRHRAHCGTGALRAARRWVDGKFYLVVRRPMLAKMNLQYTVYHNA
jgi:hypothetical protein